MVITVLGTNTSTPSFYPLLLFCTPRNCKFRRCTSQEPIQWVSCRHCYYTVLTHVLSTLSQTSPVHNRFKSGATGCFTSRTGFGPSSLLSRRIEAMRVPKYRKPMTGLRPTRASSRCRRRRYAIASDSRGLISRAKYLLTNQLPMASRPERGQDIPSCSLLRASEREFLDKLSRNRE